MKNAASNPESAETAKSAPGSQTLLRGLDVLDAVVDGPLPLAELAQRLGLTRSTTHRLANALIDRRFLTFQPRLGYQFGPKLLELGFLAQRQADIVQIARPHLETLAMLSEDTVHLGILDDDQALYLDKIPGRRRVEISSRVGDRQPLTSTGLGKALLLDDGPPRWQTLFADDRPSPAPTGAPATTGAPTGAAPAGTSADADWPAWLERMHGYVAAGHAFDLEENEDQIRCVAAPIRDASGGIVAAISVSSAAQYMADHRMTQLSADVTNTAKLISQNLGWTKNTPKPAPRPRRRT